MKTKRQVSFFYQNRFYYLTTKGRAYIIYEDMNGTVKTRRIPLLFWECKRAEKYNY